MDPSLGNKPNFNKNFLLAAIENAGPEDLGELYRLYREGEQQLFDLALEANELGACPAKGFLMFGGDVKPLIESVDHVGHARELSTEEWERYKRAICAGRVSPLTVGDVAVADMKMFESLADFVVADRFRGKALDYLKNGYLRPREYRELVNKLGKQILNIDEELIYGQAEFDRQVFNTASLVNGITALALMSGSENTRQRALDFLGEAYEQITSDGHPVVKEAIYLGELLYKVTQNEEPFSKLEAYKEVLGEDWDEALTQYAMMFLISVCSRKLKNAEFTGSPQVINNLRKRLHIEISKFALADRYNEIDKQAKAGSAQDHIDTDPVLDTQELFAQLDWTILPPGETELIKEAEEIVEGAQRPDKAVVIDLERLRILKAIKDMWGPDRAYYARGRLKSPRKVAVDGKESPDEYIVLVLQELKDGVILEHAIAESPIAGPHALYVYRSDVGEKSWREVYSFPKHQARQLTARQVKHTHVGTKPLIDTMIEKVSYLMTCEPEEFAEIRFNGRDISRIRKIGEIANRKIA